MILRVGPSYIATRLKDEISCQGDSSRRSSEREFPGIYVISVGATNR